MAQHDYVVANDSGAGVRADLNNALSAIVSINSGASAPSTTYAYMLWADTTNGVLKRRNAANSGWLVVRSLDETTVLSRSSNTMLDLSDIGKAIRVTGSYTQTLDAVATLGDGWWVAFRVESGATLTFDPNSTETIDGQTTLAIVGPASGFVYCNGSALFTVGVSLGPAVRPNFSAYSTAGTTMTSATPTKCAFNAEDWDVGGNFDAVTNYRFTPSVAGKYLVCASASLAAINAGKVWFLSVYKNGSAYKQGAIMSNGSGAVINGYTALCQCEVDMNGSTDYIEIYGYNSDVNQNLSTGQSLSHFSARWVGA